MYSRNKVSIITRSYSPVNGRSLKYDPRNKVSIMTRSYSTVKGRSVVNHSRNLISIIGHDSD